MSRRPAKRGRAAVSSPNGDVAEDGDARNHFPYRRLGRSRAVSSRYIALHHTQNVARTLESGPEFGRKRDSMLHSSILGQGVDRARTRRFNGLGQTFDGCAERIETGWFFTPVPASIGKSAIRVG